ncbi:DNA repair family protein [Seiridium cupressi]
MATKKRTIDAFFGAPKPNTAISSKKSRASPVTVSKVSDEAIKNNNPDDDETAQYSRHPAYPFPIAHLPTSISTELPSLPSSIGRPMTDQPDLDLLYFEPYLPRYSARLLFEFLRSNLPFYRVEYDINRGGVSTHIRTPRWTTVYGLDETSRFVPSTSKDNVNDATDIVDAKTGRKVVGDRYYDKYAPRPLPHCLDELRKSCEAATGCVFNFCLVNYYASGSDSISFHSDDERFLGPLPAIASFSLGARRDFYMKHKPPPKNQTPKQGEVKDEKEAKPLKLPLGSGDMILMRGTTQANWLHSIPKRTGKNAEDGGRINITFRRAMVKAGTENYYNYNVGTGPVYRWDALNREMRVWEQPKS